MPDPDTVTTTEATSSEGTTVAATRSTTTKPGWKTSEMWLTFGTALVGALMASGLFADGSKAMRIAGVAAMVLASFGYTVSRGAVKRAGAGLVMIFGFLVVPPSTGCAGLKSKSTTGGRAFVDCAKASAKQAALELAPTFLAVLRNALTSDGKIDRPTIREVAAPLKSEAMRCAFDAAIAAIMTPAKPTPGAPQSEALAVDATDVATAYAGVRIELWDNVEIKRAQ